MDMIGDVLTDLPSLQSNSTLFSYQLTEELQDNTEQQQHESMLTIATTKREKRTVSFPFGKCRICQDIATGLHYGVVTCEGCKGFFKRCITQGLPYQCFFGDKCLVSIETRNRCKACRFKRCVEKGMAMESVKMGRIPKKVKEKALKDYYRDQEKTSTVQRRMDSSDTDNFDYGDYDDQHLSSIKRESVSSTSSSSSSITRQSIDSNQEIVTLPPRIFDSSEQSFHKIDLIELTISSSSIHIDCFNNKLSSLRLPPVFHKTFSSPRTFPETFAETSIHFPQRKKSIDQTSSAATATVKTNQTMTVLNYVSTLNQHTLVGYICDFELRYEKIVLQTMKYLASKLCQPYLIYELDFEMTSFFRYIRWKMLTFYMKNTKRLRTSLDRMFKIINSGIADYPGANPTSEQLWIDIQITIPDSVVELLDFAKDTLGLNELNVHDFTTILNNRVFDFWVIINYPLFYKNESYVTTRNGLHYKRHFMSKFIGQRTTDALHEFSQRLHALNLTQVEHSLIVPIILCLPDNQLTDSDSVHIIKYCYMYALYIQLCTTRTEDEAKSVFDNILQIIESMTDLNELCKKNIGELVLDKSTP